MVDLAALKVKIGLKSGSAGRQAAYPDFGSLPSVKASGMDWAHYIDIEGGGWEYDKTSGHREETADSPLGQQWGMLLVPEQFANEAVAAFPGECSRLTEADCQVFFESKSRAHLDDVKRDVQVLQGLQEELTLAKEINDTARVTALRTYIAKALDPNDSTPGVRRNGERLWVDYKVARKIVFKAPI